MALAGGSMGTEVGGNASEQWRRSWGLGSWVSAAPSEGLGGAEGGSLRGEERRGLRCLESGKHEESAKKTRSGAGRTSIRWWNYWGSQGCHMTKKVDSFRRCPSSLSLGQN